MKIMVTGAGGQLGRAVVQELRKRGAQAGTPDSKEMDITNKDCIKRTFEAFRPDTVIHCAAYTDVDKAEGEAAKAYQVNTQGTAYLAESCRAVGAKMLYVSTDYVFDGSGTGFWRPEDRCAPLNVYGKTKYEGELAVEELLDTYFIVRTSWVFGEGRGNFVTAMLNRGREQGRVQVVCDQIGSPSYTRDLAALFADMIDTDKYGVYHAANAGTCSRLVLAQEIFAQAEALGHAEYGQERLLAEPVLTAEIPSRAARPLNSRLNTDKLSDNGFNRPAPWQDALRRYLTEIGL